jgi:hypothetical protein
VFTFKAPFVIFAITSLCNASEVDVKVRVHDTDLSRHIDVTFVPERFNIEVVSISHISSSVGGRDTQLTKCFSFHSDLIKVPAQRKVPSSSISQRSCISVFQVMSISCAFFKGHKVVVLAFVRLILHVLKSSKENIFSQPYSNHPI